MVKILSKNAFYEICNPMFQNIEKMFPLLIGATNAGIQNSFVVIYKVKKIKHGYRHHVQAKQARQCRAHQKQVMVSACHA